MQPLQPRACACIAHADVDDARRCHKARVALAHVARNVNRGDKLWKRTRLRKSRAVCGVLFRRTHHHLKNGSFPRTDGERRCDGNTVEDRTIPLRGLKEADPRHQNCSNGWEDAIGELRCGAWCIYTREFRSAFVTRRLPVQILEKNIAFCFVVWRGCTAILKDFMLHGPSHIDWEENISTHYRTPGQILLRIRKSYQNFILRAHYAPAREKREKKEREKKREKKKREKKRKNVEKKNSYSCTARNHF